MVSDIVHFDRGGKVRHFYSHREPATAFVRPLRPIPLSIFSTYPRAILPARQNHAQPVLPCANWRVHVHFPYLGNNTLVREPNVYP